MGEDETESIRFRSRVAPSEYLWGGIGGDGAPW